ncbi:MAG: IMPACT family protein, partial [Planctomycetes bacterium]|nr:IMPACT family protein [Planctomycetota bacterium]
MLTLAGPHTYEEVIKKSRFIARAAPVKSPEETFAFLDAVRDPTATHNCWVFRIGTNYRFSDDGEPKGTAGRPMLNALERLGLDQVMVVVTRHFGGIKLGSGGLTRAYGGVTAACLRDAPKMEVRPAVLGRFEAGFDGIGQVYLLMNQFDVEKRSEQYTDKGILVEVSLLEEKLQAFKNALSEMSRGSIQLELIEE